VCYYTRAFIFLSRELSESGGNYGALAGLSGVSTVTKRYLKNVDEARNAQISKSIQPKPEDESEKGLTGVDLLAYKIRKIQSILRKWSVK
jgi:hypothetical protein